MNKILYLEKRGCNFSDGLDGGESIKLVGNYPSFVKMTEEEFNAEY